MTNEATFGRAEAQDLLEERERLARIARDERDLV